MKTTLGYAKFSNGSQSTTWTYTYFVRQSWGAEQRKKLLKPAEAKAKLAELLANNKLIVERDHPQFHSWEFEA